MQRIGDEIHVTETEACGGEQHHHVRYILGISLLLGIALLSAIWIIASITK